MHNPEGLGAQDYELMERVPADRSRLEALCYRSAAGAFLPYVCADRMRFDTSTIRPVLKKAGLQCPRVDRRALRLLIAYARDRNFGLEPLKKNLPTAA